MIVPSPPTAMTTSTLFLTASFAIVVACDLSWVTNEVSSTSCPDYTFEKETKDMQDKPKGSFFKKKNSSSNNSSKKNHRFKFKKKDTN